MVYAKPASRNEPHAPVRRASREYHEINGDRMSSLKYLTVACTGLFILALTTASVVAQVYPSRPITLIVGFAAGGPTDVIARIFAQRMSSSLGQPVVVENIPGATGSISTGRLVRSAPDGYTIIIGNPATHVTNVVIYSLQYDVLRDMEPIALLPSNPFILISNASVPATNLVELIAWLKANPTKATLGTAGVGSGPQLAGLLFEKLSGAHVQYVPYRGTAPALTAVIAGQINLIIDQSSEAVPHLRDDHIRAYAVTAKTRLASAPAVPTADEANLPGFCFTYWNGLWAPKGTPQPIIAKLNAAAVEAMADPVVREKLADLGQDIPTREQQTPQALAAFQQAEIDKWWPILKAANVKIE
jgi:tripartite-type tricarboxylate transporter receptor subunit TctC